MPVAGLPAPAETALNALLTENNVSSLKVVWEEDDTVIVLAYDTNPTPNLRQQKWRTRITLRRPVFEEEDPPPDTKRTRKELHCENNGQEKPIMQAGSDNFDFSSFVFVKKKNNFILHRTLTLTWQHSGIRAQRSVGLYARKWRLTWVTNIVTLKMGQTSWLSSTEAASFCFVCDDSNLIHQTFEMYDRFIQERAWRLGSVQTESKTSLLLWPTDPSSRWLKYPRRN